MPLLAQPRSTDTWESYLDLPKEFAAERKASLTVPLLPAY